MAGEAVSGRYGAARHAVADEGGAPRHPASDDRSLVDRLLASSGGDQEFDWGWGEPSSGGPAPDREPLHDIPELWGPDERVGRESGGTEDARFPSPRRHGESPVDGDRDWLGSDDRGSDDWGAPAPDLDGRGPDDQRFSGLGIDDDPLGVLSSGRVPAEHGPLGDDEGGRSLPSPGPLHDGAMDGEHAGARAGAGPLDRAPADRP
ncbi:hypothetical protein, partial [Pseudonocardia zijingensis]|uniref:hypothetical protein n=1 Tax=Pseudonocardia zijingensis TaxID=153376 RepID=UPI0031CFAEAE